MTELYAASRDGVREGLSPLFALVMEPPMRYSKLPTYPQPWYLPAAPEPVRDLAAGRAQMADLALRYPNNVKGF